MELKNSHLLRTVAVAGLIATLDGFREDHRLSKNPFVALQLYLKAISSNQTRASNFFNSYKDKLEATVRQL